MKKCLEKTLVLAALLGLFSTINPQLSTLHAQGTAFTYQGRLNAGVDPANGNYDLRFTIYDSPSAGLVVGGPLTNAPTAASNGLFVVTLDFGGGVFTGPARWLEIGVRTNGSAAAYQTLSPRQPLTAAPYAVTAGEITGVVPSTSLSGVYPGAVTFSNAADVFGGNGAGLTLNANQLTSGTVPPAALANAWKIIGNAGTSPTNGNFLGTADNQPLELRVNNARAVRIEPGGTNGPNVIGGYAANWVLSNVVGAVIGGGGGASVTTGVLLTNIVTDSHSVVGGGLGNIAGDNDADPASAGFATVGGGVQNQAASRAATIAGGDSNVIGTNAGSATIAGGTQNTIQTNGAFSAIGGGSQNSIQAVTFNNNLGGYNSTIAGGLGNVIGSPYDAIGGGSYHSIGTNSNSGTVGGGYFNVIGNNTFDSTISGGSFHSIGTNCLASTISGGTGNSIGNNAASSAIGGGYNNKIQSGATYSTLAGGYNNTIQSGATYATLGGGDFNSAAGSYSTVSGGFENTASSYGATAGGGVFNGSSSFYSTVGGGYDNHAYAEYSTVGGGYFNSASVISSTVGGGFQNSASADSATASGGAYNNATGSGSVVSGGVGNIANAYAAVVNGGISNNATGPYATVAGGSNNLASGSYSFAAGSGAMATNNNSFVWSDGSSTNFSSTGTNQFLILAAGGVGINTINPSGTALAVAGPAQITGGLSVTGAVSATTFHGDGSGLINVSAGALGNYVYAFNGALQVVATANVFQDIGFATDAQISGWTHTPGAAQYTSAQTGLYLVQFTAHATSTNSLGNSFQLRALLNGAEIVGSRSASSIATTFADLVSISKSFITTANASDVLTLQFTGPNISVRLTSPGVSMTITRLQ